MKHEKDTYRLRFNQLVLGGLLLLFVVLIGIFSSGTFIQSNNKLSQKDFENELMGQAYFAAKSGNYQAEILLYKKVVERIPEMESELTYKIGKAEYLLGDYIEAMAHFNTSLKTGYRDSLEVFFNVALTAHKLKKYFMAEKYYLKTLDHPEYGKEAYFNLGNLYFFEYNNEVKAFGYYQSAIENESVEKAYNDMLLRELKVNTERKNHELNNFLMSEQGKEYPDLDGFDLDEFARNKPDKVQAHIHNYMGIIQVNKNNKQAAISHFQQAMAIDPEFKDARFNFNKLVSEIKK